MIESRAIEVPRHCVSSPGRDSQEVSPVNALDDTTPAPLTKRCPKCEVDKPCEDFAQDKSRRDGLQTYCKSCQAVYYVRYREHLAARQAANRETYLEKRRAYYAENRERFLAQAAAYYLKHRPKILAYHADYYNENRERLIEHAAAYQAAHPELYRAHSRNRLARKKGNGGTHTAADIQAQYDRQKGKCYYCKTKVGTEYHVDHVMPLTLGGSNGPENLVIACPPCNLSKRAKHPMDFAGRLL